MTEEYPVVESSESQVDSAPLPPPPTPSPTPTPSPSPSLPSPADAVVVKFGTETAVVDVSSAVTVDDVIHTLLSVFRLSRGARTIMKRESDGAVVVPGPKLPPGEYLLQEVEAPWKVAYKNIRDTHYPAARQHLQEKTLPFVASAGQAGAKSVGEALQKAHAHAGTGLAEAGTRLQMARGHLAVAGGHVSRGLTVAGGHVNRGLAVAGTHVGAALSTTGTHVGGALSTAGTHVQTQLRNLTTAATAHTTANSTTWYSKLWLGLVRCAPAPISFITGIPTEELLRVEEPPSSTDGVPVSTPATTS